MLGKSNKTLVARRLYDFVFELNAIAPTILLSVLPQLEFKLKVRPPRTLTVHYGYWLPRFNNNNNNISVPARLGKGQGAKEIGHNLAHERPKFGHNLVHKRHKIGHNPARERNEVWAQFCGRLMKTWAQICKQLQTFLHQLSENRKTANTFCKKKK